MPKAIELDPCPFCGQWIGLEWIIQHDTRGYPYSFYAIAGHTDGDCVLDHFIDELDPMDVNEALRFAEAWNERA